jgi:hypothetical protein
VTYFAGFYAPYNDLHPPTTLAMLTPNQVNTGQAASPLAARQTHQAEVLTGCHCTSHAPITLEELNAEPLLDVPGARFTPGGDRTRSC